jgi:GTPase
MKFVDEARIHVKAGPGGNGCMSFRRERFIPKGGPDGGDGGKGGDVVLQADPQLSTLLDFSYPHELRAGRGIHGKGKKQAGKAGQDLVVRVPAGTLVKDDETGEVLQDLVVEGERFIAARGGRGGRGNVHFATPTMRAPRRSEKGEAGEERWLRLELKLLADVGLLGYPNVGKSTLLSRISSARPKIAAYPFTTLAPNLGVVVREERKPITVADIPGLIKGASGGAGLGLTFLRHVERTRVFVHVLDVSEGTVEDAVAAFRTLNEELEAFDPSLRTKPQVLALNKMDLPPVRERAPDLQACFKALGYRLHLISAETGEGLEELLEDVFDMLSRVSDGERPQTSA